MTIVIPFRGEADEAEELLAAVRGLSLRPGDEAVLVDNAPHPTVPAPPAGPIRVVHAAQEHSSYYARNVGAELSENAWLLFLDGDTRPLSAHLLDAYFAPPPDQRCGALAGDVVGAPGQTAALARHARSRRRVDQIVALAHPHRPFGLTANLAVRREAWADVGGFCEGIRSGGDQDFGWRLQEAGWTLGHRPQAAVEHLHRERLAPSLRQAARYGAGTAWLTRRHGPVANRRPPVVAGLVRHLGAAASFGVTGQRERALFKAVDALVLISVNAGFLLENRPNPPRHGSTKGAPVVAAELPSEDGEVPVASHVEARRRPLRPRAHLLRGREFAYAEDDGYVRRLAAAARLLRRRPLRAAAAGADLLALAPRAERLEGATRLLALTGAAVPDAQRLARLLGLRG
jgi:GT2 family glycosyltransferase